MTPSLKNIAWLKLFCSISDYNDKKVFVEVSIIIMVVVLSFVWFMDWTDRFIHKGGIGIFDIFFRIGFCAMEFWFFRLCVHYGLRIFRSLAYVFRFRHKYLSYGFRIWFPKWFSDFPIWIPVSLRSKRPLISKCSTCQHCIGSIRVLRTGMWTLIDFDGFAWGFRFWSNFFAVLRLWIIFSTA